MEVLTADAGLYAYFSLLGMAGTLTILMAVGIFADILTAFVRQFR